MYIQLPFLQEQRMDLASPDVEAPLEVATLVADRTRAGILALLQAGPHCVCEMAAALGERQNNVSNHLVRLREAGLAQPDEVVADVVLALAESSCHFTHAMRARLKQREDAGPGPVGDEGRDLE